MSRKDIFEIEYISRRRICNMAVSKQAHNLKPALYQRRCDAMPSRRRRYDVISTQSSC